MKKSLIHIPYYKLQLCCFLLLVFCYSGFSQQGKKEWLSKLNEEISKSPHYDSEKLIRIDSLKKQAGNYIGRDLFEQYLRIYEEYAVFNFDSAYFFAKKMQETSSSLEDTSLIKYAGIKLSFILLSSGMYKEVHEELNKIKPTGLNDLWKAEYYILKARSNFDLADYNHDNYFSNSYNNEAEKFLDSSLVLLPVNSFQFSYYNGLKSIRAGDIPGATAYFQKLITDPELSLHEQAIINSTFSDIYIRRGFADSAIILLAKAAIADIQSSVKETAAILNLATILFNQRDLENASIFIQKASNDAKTYGARQRMAQLSTIIPLIEAERLIVVKKEKNSVTKYATIITLSLVFLLILSAVIISQIRKLKIQQRKINNQNMSLHHMVEEKEWLIKEIHHRVKNNLHTITSLLESQSAYLGNEALSAIRDTQHRVFAMSLIHQKLYQPEKNVTKIDMPVYLHELVNYLSESFETNRRIHFRMELEPVELDISLAIPLGLILNEAITNSVKYAFPDRKEGVITISIKKTGESRFQFSVADNGVGLPSELNITKVNSLGMKLMKGLSDDIMAKFQIENLAGTKISIEFMADKSIEHLQHATIRS